MALLLEFGGWFDADELASILCPFNLLEDSCVLIVILDFRLLRTVVAIRLRSFICAFLLLRSALLRSGSSVLLLWWSFGSIIESLRRI